MAMKQCKDCGAEISKGAKTCPKCGKDQRNFFSKHKFITFILIVILLCVIVVAGSSGDTNTTTDTSSETTSEEKTSFEVGETYTDDDVSITFISADDNFTNYSEYADVESGYKIVQATFEFENLGDTDFLASAYEFNCYADGYDCEDFWSVDDSGFSSTLSTGKKATGSVYFEVPKDATSIILEYELNVWTSEKVEFIVK